VLSMGGSETSSGIEEASALVDACTSIRSAAMMTKAHQGEKERSCRSRCDLSYAAFREHADIKVKSEIEKTSVDEQPDVSQLLSRSRSIILLSDSPLQYKLAEKGR
jgi:hypothetical protein